MNTSYNKSRIVDDGWKPVIFNCVAAQFSCIFPHRSTRISQRLQTSNGPSLAKKKNTNTKDIQRILDRPSTSNQIDHPIAKIKNRNQVDGKEQPNISIISKLEVEIHSSDDMSTQNQQKSDPAQSTSSTNKIIPGRSNETLLVRNISYDSESDDGDKPHRKSYRLRMGEEILRNMLININNEESYLHYFRQLIDFENSVKCCEDGNLDRFTIIPFSSSNDTKQCQIKASGVCQMNNTASGRRKSTDMRRSKNKPSEEIILKCKFSVEPLIDRIELRQGILQPFQMHCDDKESYEDFINTIFNFEESLIDN